MESYWPSVVKHPTGNKPTDEFAVLIDNISKIVFSRTLKNVDWKNTQLKKEVIKEEVLELKQSPNGGHFETLRSEGPSVNSPVREDGDLYPC
jgi:hypothetical protein